MYYTWFRCDDINKKEKIIFYRITTATTFQKFSNYTVQWKNNVYFKKIKHHEKSDFVIF